MRTFLIIISLWLGFAAAIFAAETLTLTDGATVSGDIIKFDDGGVMIHNSEDTVTNVKWTQFSQDSLKHLAENPKFAAFAEPFIEPTAPAHPPKAEIRPPSVTRVMDSPDKLHPSLLGGLVQSSLGLFMLLILYAANLYAAFEVAVVRGKPIPVVVGLAAVLPVMAQVIFLMQPIKVAEEETAPQEPSPEGAPTGTTPAPGQDIQIVAASWQPSQEEKKPQPQVFSRGRFTLNKRFLETKFANFIGEPKGEAKIFSMEIKTLKETLAVECIKQAGLNEAILETPNGQVSVPYADIQEIKLIPKPA